MHLTKNANQFRFHSVIGIIISFSIFIGNKNSLHFSFEVISHPFFSLWYRTLASYMGKYPKCQTGFCEKEQWMVGQSQHASESHTEE